MEGLLHTRQALHTQELSESAQPSIHTKGRSKPVVGPLSPQDPGIHTLSSLTPSSSPCSFHSLLVFKHIRLAPASGPLHRLFPCTSACLNPSPPSDIFQTSSSQ